MKYKSSTIGMDENPNKINKVRPIAINVILDPFPPEPLENFNAKRGISEIKSIPNKIEAKSTNPVDSLK